MVAHSHTGTRVYDRWKKTRKKKRGLADNPMTINLVNFIWLSRRNSALSLHSTKRKKKKEKKRKSYPIKRPSLDLAVKWRCRSKNGRVETPNFRLRSRRELRLASVKRACRLNVARLDLVTRCEIHNTVYCTFIIAARTRSCILGIVWSRRQGLEGGGSQRSRKKMARGDAPLNNHRDHRLTLQIARSVD